jgi:hypothetical protein
MKLRLTEGQYKRLLSEDNKSRFNTITPQVVIPKRRNSKIFN